MTYPKLIDSDKIREKWKYVFQTKEGGLPQQGRRLLWANLVGNNMTSCQKIYQLSALNKGMESTSYMI